MDLFIQILTGIVMVTYSVKVDAPSGVVRSLPFWVGVILIILSVVGYSLAKLTNVA